MFITNYEVHKSITECINVYEQVIDTSKISKKLFLHMMETKVWGGEKDSMEFIKTQNILVLDQRGHVYDFLYLSNISLVVFIYKCMYK